MPVLLIAADRLRSRWPAGGLSPESRSPQRRRCHAAIVDIADGERKQAEEEEEKLAHSLSLSFEFSCKSGLRRGLFADEAGSNRQLLLCLLCFETLNRHGSSGSRIFECIALRWQAKFQVAKLAVMIVFS